MTKLNFLMELPLYTSEKPYYFVERYPEVPPASLSNCQYQPRDTKLIDLRGSEDQFTLAEAGWQYLHHKSANCLDITAFLGDQYCQETVDNYLSECVEVIQGLYPTSKLVCFDWRVSHSHGLPMFVSC